MALLLVPVAFFVFGLIAGRWWIVLAAIGVWVGIAAFLVVNDGWYGAGWGDFVLNELPVEIDGERMKLVDSKINFHFAPPPGWRNHIER